MPVSRRRFPLRLRVALTVGLLVFASRSHAAEGGFATTLSAEQQTTAGLNKLSATERAALDQFVARELGQVRQGGLTAFNGTFVSRRTGLERQSAGLDRLTPAELTTLDELVATSLAAHPKPKERPRIKDSDVFNPPPKPEIHGSLSLTYGRGRGGRSFRGSSFSLDYFDPTTGLGLSVGLANYSGKGFYSYYPDYYGWPDYNSELFYLESSAHGLSSESFRYGEGQSFRTMSAWDSSGRVRWHH